MLLGVAEAGGEYGRRPRPALVWANLVVFAPAALYTASLSKCVHLAFTATSSFDLRLRIMSAFWQVHFLLCFWPPVHAPEAAHGDDLDVTPEGIGRRPGALRCCIYGAP